MVFTRCISGEPDQFCPTRRNQCNSDHTARRGVSSSSSRFRLRHLLKWKNGKSENQSSSGISDNNYEGKVDVMAERCQNPANDERIDNLAVAKIVDSKMSLIQRCSSAPPMHRQDEKSLLSFHQEYSIIKHIGAGSYSTVKRVIHRMSGESFACKIVDKLSLSPIDRLALRHEIEVLRYVDHEHIMKLYDVIEDDTKCYMVMELVEHGDLFDRVVKRGKVTPIEAQKIAAGLVHALHYCHTNAIIHRDIKPENVLIHRECGVKLCDFGFAKRLKTVGELSADSCGTPGYAAPEILDGKLYGIEVDIFSLGVVIYIILSGYPPFPMKLSQLRAHNFGLRFPSKDWIHIDPRIRELLAEMLQVDPTKRPKTSDLVSHPWIVNGKEMLDKSKAKLLESRSIQNQKRKEKLASVLEKKLRATEYGPEKGYGINTIKHEDGESFRTKIFLSADGSTLRWVRKTPKFEAFRLCSRRALSSFFRRLPSTLSNENLSKPIYSKPHEGSKLHPFSHLHPALRRLNDLEGFQIQRKPRSKIVNLVEDPCPPSREKSTWSGSSLSLHSSLSIRETITHARKHIWWTNDIPLALAGDFVQNNDPVAAQDQTRAPERPQSSVELVNITQIQIGNPSLDVETSGRDTNTQNRLLCSPTERRKYLSNAKPFTSCLLSLKSSQNAIHLEFTDQDTRDTFSYLIDRLCREKHRVEFSQTQVDQNQEEHELEGAYQVPEECSKIASESATKIRDNDGTDKTTLTQNPSALSEGILRLDTGSVHTTLGSSTLHSIISLDD